MRNHTQDSAMLLASVPSGGRTQDTQARQRTLVGSSLSYPIDHGYMPEAVVTTSQAIITINTPPIADTVLTIPATSSMNNAPVTPPRKLQSFQLGGERPL